jgi:hypothetical protein
MATEKAADNLGANQVSGVTPEQIEQAAQFEQRYGPTAPVTAKQALGAEVSGGELQDVAKRIERIADFVESEGYVLRHGIDGIPERPVGDNTEIGLEEALHRYRDAVTGQTETAPRNVTEYEQAKALTNGMRLQFNADAAAIGKLTNQPLAKAISEKEIQIAIGGPKQKPQEEKHSREDLIRQLRAYAEKDIKAQKEAEKEAQQKIPPYLRAETAIALNLANQLEAGAKTIDLSQRYATDDPVAAQARHQKALENLAPVLREAEKQTDRLQHGQALAHGKGEVLALQNFKQGIANGQGLLQKAAHSNNHHAQAPRLSISSDGGL